MSCYAIQNRCGFHGMTLWRGTRTDSSLAMTYIPYCEGFGIPLIEVMLQMAKDKNLCQ